MASVWSVDAMASYWILIDYGTFKCKDLLWAGPKDTNLEHFWLLNPSSHLFLSLLKWDHLYKPTIRVLDTWQAYIKCYFSFHFVFSLWSFFGKVLHIKVWTPHKKQHNNNILGAHCCVPALCHQLRGPGARAETNRPGCWPEQRVDLNRTEVQAALHFPAAINPGTMSGEKWAPPVFAASSPT